MGVGREWVVALDVEFNRADFGGVDSRGVAVFADLAEGGEEKSDYGEG